MSVFGPDAPIDKLTIIQSKRRYGHRKQIVYHYDLVTGNKNYLVKVGGRL